MKYLEKGLSRTSIHPCVHIHKHAWTHAHGHMHANARTHAGTHTRKYIHEKKHKIHEEPSLRALIDSLPVRVVCKRCTFVTYLLHLDPSFLASFYSCFFRTCFALALVHKLQWFGVRMETVRSRGIIFEKSISPFPLGFMATVGRLILSCRRASIKQFRKSRLIQSLLHLRLYLPFLLDHNVNEFLTSESELQRQQQQW